MSYSNKKTALDNIQANIEKHGHHIYFVSGGATPRYAYTIGLYKKIGFELILAGSSYYSHEEAQFIINESARRMIANHSYETTSFIIGTHGLFSFRSVDGSWSSELILGAFDFYNDNNILAVQIVPDRAHETFDTPDLSTPWMIKFDPVWKWLYISWDKTIPENSVAITNLLALRGEKITEATRWEDDQWEIFSGSGPEVQENEVRVVPLAILLALDPSLEVVAQLKIGEGCWRDENHDWQSWRNT